MDYDRLALFLSASVKPCFRRSLRFSTYSTLSKSGFRPGETVPLAASMAKGHGKGSDTYERERIYHTFQKIDVIGFDPGEVVRLLVET